jgi:hypothetical protein
MLHSILAQTGELAGRLDFPIATLCTQTFRDYIGFLFNSAVRLRQTVPGINLAEIIPRWSEHTLSEAMIKVAEDRFTKCIQVVSRDVRFVCLICDAGTVVNSKVVHAAFTNPANIDDIVTLPPFENLDWDATASFNFFRQTVTTYAGDDATVSLEICGVVCDNLPAQVVGLQHFLASDDGHWAGIMHVPCLNHMANLVFSHVIKETVFHQVAQALPDIVRSMNSRPVVEIIGKQCPKIIRTRWVYLVDILGFIINHYPSVHDMLHLIDGEDIASLYRPVHLLLLPLSLFSRVMETRSRILADVIPAAQEVLREWGQILSVFSDNQGIVECLDLVSAHFLARLRRNSLCTILTAFALSPFGRAEIRIREQGFQTQGETDPVPTPSFVEKMQTEFAHALETVRHPQLSDEDIHQPAVSTGPQDLIDATGDSAGAEPTDFVEPEEIVIAECPPEPVGITGDLSFSELLQHERTIRLQERIDRDLLDTIIPVAEAQIAAQATYLGYADDEIIHALRGWWVEDRAVPLDVHPDKYWRQLHGESRTIAKLAHVAWRFIALVCSEADIERLLCRHNHIQGESGSNYRTDTIHARLVIHESR